MASLQFTVWEGAAETALGEVIQESEFTVTGTSAQGDVLTPADKKIRKVRVVSIGGDAWVTWGTNPTALNDGTEGRWVGQSNPEYFSIQSGNQQQIFR